MRPEDEIAALRAPDEAGARARAWTVVRAAHRDRPPVRRARRPAAVLIALAPALIAVVAVVALTRAGTTVSGFIGHALGVPSAGSQLALPTSGRLLVTARGGTYVVSADGSRARLGDWRQATWSPHGRYLAVAGAGRLAAIDPHGRIQWSLARPAVSDASWYSPTGYRVAYLSGGTLRVVAGDGTGDRLLAARVQRVAPAWRPGHPYQLTYAARGRIVTRDADTGDVLWTARARGVRELQWSASGTRLLVRTRTGVTVLAGRGTPIAALAAPAVDAALSPDGRQLALVRGGADRDVAIAGLIGASAEAAAPESPPIRSVMSAPGADQVAWSPNGRWLLVSWPAADQWVFLAAGRTPRIVAVSKIARQFAPGAREASAGGAGATIAGRTAEFPRVDGWCCTAAGG